MFHLGSSERAKRVAQDLKSELDRRGLPIKLSGAQEIAARFFWYRNWQDLVRNHAIAEPSKDDAMVSEQLVKARRDHHIHVLVDSDVPVTMASEVIDVIRPTDRSRVSLPALYDLKGLGITMVDEWVNAISRQHGLCIIASPKGQGIEETMKASLFYLREQGANVQLSLYCGSRQNYEDVLTPGDSDRGVDVYAFTDRLLTPLDMDSVDTSYLRRAMRLATSSMVICHVNASSADHVLALLDAAGAPESTLRHILRGILVQNFVKKLSAPGQGGDYSGSVLVSECVEITGASQFENCCRHGVGSILSRPHDSPDWLGIERDALAKLKDGLTDESEIRRVFGLKVNPKQAA